VDVHWQVQEAKQRFSELLRRVASDGPQYVTKHGKDVAVVVDIAEYLRLTGHKPSFKRYLESMPPFDDDIDFEIGRKYEYTRRDAELEEIFGISDPPAVP
jgi:prevent-host-death family protein